MANTQYRKNLKSVLEASKNYTDKQIKDLQWYLGGYDLSVGSDNQAKYQKALPSGTIALELNQIGGMSYKYNQLANKRLTTSTIGDLTITSNGNKFIVNGTQQNVVGDNVSNALYYYVNNIPNHKILLGVVSNNSNIKSYEYQSSSVASATYGYYIVNVDSNGLALLRLVFEAGTYTNAEFFGQVFDLTSIFGSGNEPSDVASAKTSLLSMGINIDEYNAYSSGEIRDTKTTSVVVSGFNKFDKSTAVSGYISDITGELRSSSTLSASDYMPVLPNQTLYAYGLDTSDNYGAYYDINKIFIQGANFHNGETSVVPSNAYYLRKTIGRTSYIDTACINISNQDLNGTYKPYQTPIQVNIPAEIQALEGYGYGYNDNIKNYINFDTNKFRKEFARVDLSTLNWLWWASNNCWYCDMASAVNMKNDSSITTTLQQVDDYVDMPNNSIRVRYQYVYIKTNGTQEVLPSGYLYYELATPIETDISAYLPSGFNNIATNDNYTDLELANQFNADMPNSVSYLIEEVKE